MYVADGPQAPRPVYGLRQDPQMSDKLAHPAPSFSGMKASVLNTRLRLLLFQCKQYYICLEVDLIGPLLKSDLIYHFSRHMSFIKQTTQSSRLVVES